MPPILDDPGARGLPSEINIGHRRFIGGISRPGRYHADHARRQAFALRAHASTRGRGVSHAANEPARRLPSGPRPGMDHRLQLDADENGIVRFHARPSKNAKPIEFALEYKDQHGATVRQAVCPAAVHPVRHVAAAANGRSTSAVKQGADRAAIRPAPTR
jgi:hypothetical protein